MQDIFYTVMPSPVGPLFLAAEDTGLLAVTIAPDPPADTERLLQRYRPGKRLRPGDCPVLAAAREQLGEYFAGARRGFSLPLGLCGTAFQQKVWQMTAQIGYGRTATYRELAERCGTHGYRAVAQALRRNPLPIVVPCHRVVASDGPGGFSLGEGLETKRILLAIEGVALDPADQILPGREER